MKSIFYSSRLDDNSKTASARVKKLIKPPAGSFTAPPPKSAAATPAVPLESRPLPTPPPAPSGHSVRKRSVRFLNIKKRDSSSSGSNSSSNDSGSSGSGSSSNSSGSSDKSS